MKYFLAALPVISASRISAQDSSICSCMRNFSVKIPKKAEENKIFGMVVIEIDRDKNCLFSNPVVKKSLGYGCDEEALRIVNLQIKFHNECTGKCKTSKLCRDAKLIQPITFQFIE